MTSADRPDAETLLARVTAAIDALAEAAEPHADLWPNVLDLRGGPVRRLPQAIEGQRLNDRAFPGANLMHDHPLLGTCYGVSRLTGEPRFREAADRYLDRFAAHCVDTPSGLFPWGEHSFWHLLEDRPGNSYNLAGIAEPVIHDHLFQAPVWLWEALWQRRPDAVVRFAHGLDRHFVTEDHGEYMRHAPLLHAGERPAAGPVGDRSCDFPRHGGHYAVDWAFAWRRDGEDAFRRQLERIADYWWTRRDAATNLLFSESRTPPTETRHHRVLNLGQTLSAGLSFLEVAELLEGADDGLATRFRERGAAYAAATAAAKHDLEGGGFVDAYPVHAPEDKRFLTGWGSRYGGATAAASRGLLSLEAYRFTGDEALLSVARAIGAVYAATPLPKEPDAPIPARDAGQALALFVELGCLEDPAWLETARDLAARAGAVYLPSDALLPRGAHGNAVYEGQLGTAYLLHNMARLAAVL